MFNTDEYASPAMCFLANPYNVGYWKRWFYQWTNSAHIAKDTELNAVAMIAKINCLWHHIDLYKEVNPNGQITNWTALDLLWWVNEWKLQESLTNFVVTLRIFLTIIVSTASCERSFWKLKLIKIYQISTMSQERLSNLAILSIERDFNVDFKTVIEKFAQIKTWWF